MAKKAVLPMDRPLPSIREAKQMSSRQKAGQLFMPAAFINDSEAAIRQTEELIRQYDVGGLCFFHSPASAATNFEGKKEIPYNADSLGTLKALIARYQRSARLPLLIAIDAEWGLAMRIENTLKFPYALTLGAMQDKESLIYEVGRHIGSDCRQAGIHWNFAPVADINQNPDNPVIGYRSFGEVPVKVSQNARAMMEGLREQGVLTAAKHFPGHGDTATDSHLGLPLINKDRDTLFANEFLPFRELIAAGVDAVMAGHLAVPSLTGGQSVPASVSHDIITGVLRGALGFQGAVVSDALNMHSVSRMFPEKGQLEWEAFQAGNDVLCFAEHVAEGIEAIVSKATAAQLDNSFARFWALKLKAYGYSQHATKPSLPYAALMSGLAQNCLTPIGDATEEIKKFRKNKFALIEIASNSGQPFTENIKKLHGCKEVNYLAPNETGSAYLPKYPQVLLAIYLPSAKPPGFFGMGKDLLGFINNLLGNAEVAVYLFGNPYFLNLLDAAKARAVVVAYQDFKEFQDMGVKHFEGQKDIYGKLPVTLKAFVK